MGVFDQVDAVNLTRRETHLWSLALGTIFTFTVTIALLMYPPVFLQPVTLTGGEVRRLFVGFCLLAGLHFGCLLDRDVVITRLRGELEEAHNKVDQFRHEASANRLESLPGFAQLQDRVAMEYRRASIIKQYLSLLVVALKPSPDVAESVEATTAVGDAAKALTLKLRGEDSCYLIGANNFCVLLPGVNDDAARRIASRLSEGLRDASGASNRFSFEIYVLNYPANVPSAREIEAALRPFVDWRCQNSTDAETAAFSAAVRE